jgi:hypothetical protein
MIYKRAHTMKIIFHLHSYVHYINQLNRGNTRNYFVLLSCAKFVLISLACLNSGVYFHFIITFRCGLNNIPTALSAWYYFIIYSRSKKLTVRNSPIFKPTVPIFSSIILCCENVIWREP